MPDVFEQEPLTAEAGARFENVPNLVLTPHVAGVTRESNRRLSVDTVNNVLRVLRGATRSRANAARDRSGIL